MGFTRGARDNVAADNTGALENIFIIMLDHVRIGFKIHYPAVFYGIQIDDPFALVYGKLILLLLVHVPAIMGVCGLFWYMTLSMDPGFCIICGIM